MAAVNVWVLDWIHNRITPRRSSRVLHNFSEWNCVWIQPITEYRVRNYRQTWPNVSRDNAIGWLADWGLLLLCRDRGHYMKDLKKAKKDCVCCLFGSLFSLVFKPGRWSQYVPPNAYASEGEQQISQDLQTGCGFISRPAWSIRIDMKINVFVVGNV